MSLNFIWCISYNWPDAVWAQFPNSPGCLTGSSVWLLLSPPPCCSWLLFQLYAWPYVFFLLPNYSEIFPGENWTSIFLFDWIFLIEDLRITLNRKKKIHSPKELWGMDCKGPKPDWAAFLGRPVQSYPSLLSPLLVLSSWFPHVQPCEIQIITKLRKVEDPWVSTGFWTCTEVCGWCWWGTCRKAGSGEARQGWRQLQCPWCQVSPS